jgi:hypothetical protein
LPYDRSGRLSSLAFARSTGGSTDVADGTERRVRQQENAIAAALAVGIRGVLLAHRHDLERAS